MLKIELPLGEKVDLKEKNKVKLITSIQELISNGYKEKEAFICFYIIVSLIGGILLVIKNNAITIEKYKNLIRIFDSSKIVICYFNYLVIKKQINL
ncbi:hypothetical protein [Clostridium estertheticum]|uniref:hypothetical protein n=1 Tax=Clostridium estertheticum TaxID=238834 RepID=UPI001CF1560A|nr:hypothetical protein [Clostridium estertheticum]MCB2355266.1 hypothetical protein [Clostridium estertheticum]WAG39550.1 hypothetical protein LL065_14745 [Clostridium estertheticum]